MGFQVERLLLDAFHRNLTESTFPTEFEEVTQNFDGNVDDAKLKIQTQMLLSSPSIIDASIVDVEQVIGKLLSLTDGMQIFTEVIKLIRLCHYSHVECHSRTVILHPQETENVHQFDNEGKLPNTPSLASCPSRSY